MNFIILIQLLVFFQNSDPSYTIGDKVTDFSLKDVVNHKTVSLSDYQHQKVLIIIFTTPSCPYSKIYEERILELVHIFKNDPVSFLLINPQSSDPEDQPSYMAKMVRDKQYPCPFLIDPEKKVSRMFSATKSPEAFVLKNLNGNFILQYRGAIDDNPQLATDVSTTYLRDAIQAVVTDGAIKINEKRAIGCIIK